MFLFYRPGLGSLSRLLSSKTMTQDQIRSIRRTIRKVLGTTFSVTVKDVDDEEVWVSLKDRTSKAKDYTVVVSRPSSRYPYIAEVEEKGSLKVITAHRHMELITALEGVLTRLKV
jgi:hypothetical protein